MRVPVIRLAAALSLTALATAALAGCVRMPDEPDVIVLTPPTQHTAEPVPEPDFWPEGTAVQNQRYFDFVNEQFQDKNGRSTAEKVVDHLVSKGFDKSAMEVTYNQTPIGLESDSIFVSVRIDDQCLIGQFRPNDYRSVVADVLGSGTCLVGDTKPITW